MKQYVYSIKGSDKKLIYMDDEDEYGNIIYSIDHQVNPPLEKRSKYSANLLIEEVDFELGSEIGRMLFSYDTHNRIISQKRFINDTLIEEIRTDYANDRITTSRIENNLIVERSIHIENGNGSKTNEFYEFGVLFEIQNEFYDPEARIYKTEVLNGDRELVSIIIEKVDEKDRVLSNIKLDPDGNPTWASKFVMENDRVIMSTYTDYLENKGEVHSCFFDDEGKQIEVLVENLKGSKIAYNTSSFNEHGDLTEEKGLTGSHYHPISPPFLHPSTKDYHLVYEYQN